MSDTNFIDETDIIYKEDLINESENYIILLYNNLIKWTRKKHWNISYQKYGC